MKPRPISWCIAPEGEPTFSEQAYVLTIQDEGGGEYIQIEDQAGKIGFDPEDWPHLRDAIELAIKHCRPGD